MPRWGWAVAAVALALSGAAVHRAYAPGTAAGAFDADSAVPVLMANAQTWRIADAYYWGQDRFGSFGFLTARIAGKLLGAAVTPGALHAWLCVFALVGALTFVLLLERGRALLVAVLLVALIAIPEVARSVFDTAQPYAWMLPTLGWVWWAIRGARSRFPLAVTAATFFALWTSISSLPLVVTMLGLEGVRVLRAAPRGSRLRGMASTLWPSFVGVLAGVLLETALRNVLYRAVRTAKETMTITGVILDRGHLVENAERVAATLTTGWVGVIVVGGLAAGLFGAWRTFWKRAAEEDSAAELAFGFSVLAAAYLPQTILFTHVRSGVFHLRYFVPIVALSALAIGAALVVLTGSLPRRERVRAAGAVLLLGFALSSLPTPAPSPEFDAWSELARRLSSRGEQTVLLGDYWSVYLLAGLAPPGAVVPVIEPRKKTRTPWTFAVAQDATELVVSHSNHEASLRDGRPAPTLSFEGAIWFLVEPDFASTGGLRLSAYRRESLGRSPR